MNTNPHLNLSGIYSLIGIPLALVLPAIVEADDAEQNGGEEPQIVGFGALRPLEQRELENAEKIEAEEDDDQARDDVDDHLMLAQEPAEGPGQRAQKDKHDGEPEDEAQSVFDDPLEVPFAAAGKVLDVDGEHRQKTGGHERDDPLQK